MNIQTFTGQEMADRFESLVVAEGQEKEVDTTERENELGKYNKHELIMLIISLEAKGKRTGTTVQDLAKAMLKDEDCLAVNYDIIAEACRILIPGSKTSSKSIASYMSKKREIWDLPVRYMVRVPRPKVIAEPETVEAEVEAEAEEA